MLPGMVTFVSTKCGNLSHDLLASQDTQDYVALQVMRVEAMRGGAYKTNKIIV